MASLTSLTWLSITHDCLAGPIPSLLGLRLTKLQHLDLSLNALTGDVPESLTGLADLRTLSLAHNGLTGTAPPALLLAMPSLTSLDLSHNPLLLVVLVSEPPSPSPPFALTTEAAAGPAAASLIDSLCSIELWVCGMDNSDKQSCETWGPNILPTYSPSKNKVKNKRCDGCQLRLEEGYEGQYVAGIAEAPFFACPDCDYTICNDCLYHGCTASQPCDGCGTCPCGSCGSEILRCAYPTQPVPWYQCGVAGPTTAANQSQHV